MLDTFEVNKVLIIAPLRVARDTWPAEIEKWDHLKNLDISIVVGDVKTRIAAVHHPAMIYVVNRENVKWLVEYYEHAIEQSMCGVRLQEIRCQMQFNAEDRAWEHYTRLREKGQYAVMPSVTVEERRRVILGAITWKYDWIQKNKKWCFQFADAVITREKNGGTEGWSQSQFIERFIRAADSLPEANRRLLDQLYEAAWNILQIYRYDADPCHVPAPWYDEKEEDDAEEADG